MSPKELTAFRIEADIMAAARRLKERDGIPLSVQIDRAWRAFLQEKRVLPATGRARAHAHVKAKRRRKS